MSTAASDEYVRWSADGLPLAVEYSSAVMQDIRAAVMDGYYKIPHGGIEVGGVLYGRARGGVVRIEAHRPLACEYAAGPSFVLSERDRAVLAGMLTGVPADEGLGTTVPVGWYHSNNRSEIRLSEEDLDIHRTFFPERWHVCLVLRPERTKPVRAGFFLRGSDGTMSVGASPCEFTPAPAGRLKSPAPRAATAVEPGPGAGYPTARGKRRLVAFVVAALLLLIGFFAGVVVTLIFWR
jgi:proteasome lid subunit RPN8/RPN11